MFISGENGRVREFCFVEQANSNVLKQEFIPMHLGSTYIRCRLNIDKIYIDKILEELLYDDSVLGFFLHDHSNLTRVIILSRNFLDLIL